MQTLDSLMLAGVHGGDEAACAIARRAYEQRQASTQRSDALLAAARIDPNGTSVGANRNAYEHLVLGRALDAVTASCP